MSYFIYKIFDISPVHYRVVIEHKAIENWPLVEIDKHEGKAPKWIWHEERIKESHEYLAVCDYVQSIMPVIL